MFLNCADYSIKNAVQYIKEYMFPLLKNMLTVTTHECLFACYSSSFISIPSGRCGASFIECICFGGSPSLPGDAIRIGLSLEDKYTASPVTNNISNNLSDPASPFRCFKLGVFLLYLEYVSRFLHGTTLLMMFAITDSCC